MSLRDKLSLHDRLQLRELEQRLKFLAPEIPFLGIISCEKEPIGVAIVEHFQTLLGSKKSKPIHLDATKTQFFEDAPSGEMLGIGVVAFSGKPHEHQAVAGRLLQFRDDIMEKGLHVLIVMPRALYEVLQKAYFDFLSIASFFAQFDATHPLDHGFMLPWPKPSPWIKDLREAILKNAQQVVGTPLQGLYDLAEILHDQELYAQAFELVEDSNLRESILEFGRSGKGRLVPLDFIRGMAPHIRDQTLRLLIEQHLPLLLMLDGNIREAKIEADRLISLAEILKKEICLWYIQAVRAAIAIFQGHFLLAKSLSLFILENRTFGTVSYFSLNLPLQYLGEVAIELGVESESAYYLKNCVESANESGSIRLFFTSIFLHAQGLIDHGEFKMADLLAQGLEKSHQKQLSPLKRISNLRIHGKSLHRQGQIANAIRMLRRAEALSVWLELKLERARSQVDLGIALTEKGRNNEAKAILKSAKAYFKENGILPGMADALMGLGLVELNMGDSGHSHQNLLESLKLNEQMRRPVGIAEAQLNLGFWHKKQGNSGDALICFEKAMEVAQQHGYQWHYCLARILAGESCLIQGDFEAAKRNFSYALPIAEEMEIPEMLERVRKGLEGC